MSRRCVSSSCLWTSESARPRFCSAICALKASMPPYRVYRGGLPPVMMSGRYFSASSSHVVTCARMSFTDQLPMTPGSVSCESDKPAYDSLIAAHAFSSCFRSCCLSMVQYLPIHRHQLDFLELRLHSIRPIRKFLNRIVTEENGIGEPQAEEDTQG